ncbi:MAG: hypothetical protein WC002_01295 [Candidatus Muiribacteriota bacterium]
MKKILMILIITAGFAVYGNTFRELQMLGFNQVEQNLRQDQQVEFRDKKPAQFSANIYDRSGFLSTSGLTGLINSPSAFVLRTGELVSGFSYIYRDGLIEHQGTFKDAKQYEKTTHLTYGATPNMELGFNFLKYDSDITGVAPQSLSLTSLNFKYSFVYETTIVGLGGHYTNITPKDQLMLSYSTLEKANSFFIAITERVSPFFTANFSLKSSMLKSIKDIPGFALDSTSFTTTSVGFDYSRIEGIHFIGEIEKLNGNFVLPDNNLVLNLGFRLSSNKLRSTLFAQNITNASDKIYGYTLNYNF